MRRWSSSRSASSAASRCAPPRAPDVAMFLLRSDSHAALLGGFHRAPSAAALDGRSAASGARRRGAGGSQADELGSLRDETASRALESSRAARLVREGLVASRAHLGVGWRVVGRAAASLSRAAPRALAARSSRRARLWADRRAVGEGEAARRGGEVDEGDEAIRERALGVRRPARRTRSPQARSPRRTPPPSWWRAPGRS